MFSRQLAERALVAVEVPISIAKAALYGQPTGTPLPTPVADAITVAKRDLKAGEILDGSGGYTVNGLIERANIARAENLLPLGLPDGIKIKMRCLQRGSDPLRYGRIRRGFLRSQTPPPPRRDPLRVHYSHGCSITLPHSPVA